MNKCIFIKENNQKCKANAIKDDEYCYFHSEKAKEKRNESVLKGGMSLKRSYGRTGSVKLRESDDILTLLEETIEDLRNNKTNTRTANTIFLLTGIALKTFEYRYIEETKNAQKRFSKATDAEFDKLFGLK